MHKVTLREQFGLLKICSLEPDIVIVRGWGVQKALHNLIKQLVERFLHAPPPHDHNIWFAARKHEDSSRCSCQVIGQCHIHGKTCSTTLPDRL